MNVPDQWGKHSVTYAPMYVIKAKRPNIPMVPIIFREKQKAVDYLREITAEWEIAGAGDANDYYAIVRI